MTFKRLKIAQDMLDKSNVASVLQLGPGHYPLKASGVRVDCDSTASPTYVYDLEKGLPMFIDNKFDCVTALEVLEHIYNTKRFLSEIHRVLKPNGYLILSVPNIVYLKYRLAFMFGKVPSHAAKADWTYDNDARGHVSDYNLESLTAHLAASGFKVIESRTDSNMPVKFGRTLIVKAVKV